MTVDVWPDLDWAKAIRTPRTVMLEQSDILKKKSKGALFLHIDTGTVSAKPDFPNGCFVHETSIWSSPLSYGLDFVDVQHAVASPYPAIVFEEKSKTGRRVDSEDELLEQLREILNKPEWITAIDRLIAMGNSK